MASWIEIERVCKDRPAFKALAKRLLADPGFERTVYEETFLSDVSTYRRDLTTREGEKLLQIRDEAEIHTNIRGLSVATLIDVCHQNRFDLDDADQGRIERLKARDRRHVRGNQMGWLRRICIQLGEMEGYM
jgi:hypothetical protein